MEFGSRERTIKSPRIIKKLRDMIETEIRITTKKKGKGEDTTSLSY